MGRGFESFHPCRTSLLSCDKRLFLCYNWVKHMNEVKRYVNLAFIFAAIIMSWFFIEFASLVMSLLSIGDERLMGEQVRISTVIGILLAVVVAFLLWRSPKIYEGSLNVAREMKKVTWPTKPETVYAMKVVVATSIIVALILFGFDFVAKQATEYVLGIR